MKYTNLKKWKPLVKKLKASYKTLEEMNEHCKKVFSLHYRIEITGSNIVGILPYYYQDSAWHAIGDIPYYFFNGKKYVKMKTKEMVEVLTEKLKDKVTVSKLIEDALNSVEPEELQEIFDRVVVKKAKVKETEGCYKLLIGGKKGLPYEFMLRG